MFSNPVDLLRPTRSFDGEGTFEVIPTPVGQIWVDPEVQDGQQVLTAHADEDVRIGDIVRVPHDLFL